MNIKGSSIKLKEDKKTQIILETINESKCDLRRDRHLIDDTKIDSLSLKNLKILSYFSNIIKNNNFKKYLSFKSFNSKFFITGEIKNIKYIKIEKEFGTKKKYCDCCGKKISAFHIKDYLCEKCKNPYNVLYNSTLQKYNYKMTMEYIFTRRIMLKFYY